MLARAVVATIALCSWSSCWTHVRAACADSTCFGQACDYWVDEGYSCATIEMSYGCGCSGCECGGDGSTDVRRRLSEVVLEDELCLLSSGVCVDTSNGTTDKYGDGCDEYAANTEWCGDYDGASFSSNDMCCGCGGGSGSVSGSWDLDTSSQFSWSSSGTCSLLAEWIDENRNYAW